MVDRTSTSSDGPAAIRSKAAFVGSLRRAAQCVADVLIPPRCLACREPLATHDTICARCWSDIAFIHAPVCDRLGIPLPFDPSGHGGGPVVSSGALADPPNYDRARASAHFSGVMREMIHAFKYADRHDARRLFGRWLHQAARDVIGEVDMLVPVPLHARRLLTRRYNQSAILAQELSRRTAIPVDMGILYRRRQTAPQVGLTRDQRRKNLRSAFEVPPLAGNRIHGKRLLLVDDVITTGTTVDTCARVLKRAGAASVDVVALAIVTDESRIDHRVDS
jgi:ComF family protein